MGRGRGESEMRWRTGEGDRCRVIGDGHRSRSWLVLEGERRVEETRGAGWYFTPWDSVMLGCSVVVAGLPLRPNEKRLLKAITFVAPTLLRLCRFETGT